MIRIPVFNKDYLFNINDNIVIEKDIANIKWVSGEWFPTKRSEFLVQPTDTIANQEVLRLLKFKTCPFCGKKMKDIAKYKPENTILVCENCLYWGGRGSRIDGPYSTRGIVGQMDFLNNLDEARIEQILSYLNSNIDKIYELSPREAEKLLPHILRDYLNCEVLAMGGVKDKGVDALAIHGDNTKMIIQIKWRQNQNRAESVSVVREVAGTLLARKIPKGFIITTRKKFSSDEIKEAKSISENTISNVGKLELTLNDYNNLIDMFEISTKKRTDKMKLEDYTNGQDEYYLFG